MSNNISPGGLLTAPANFSSGQYTSTTMCSVVREELAGKVLKNDPSNEELFDDLESVVAAAARPPVRKSDHTAQLDARAKGDGWKVEMYPPLQRLCGYIFNYSHASEPKATRNITIAANRRLKGEVYTTGFPSVSPDGTGSCVPECDSWIDVDWLIAIKAREDQGVVATDTTISEVVFHAADYARLHLSCRSFQLFSVALLVFAHKFMVGIFDRDGVSLFPVFDFCDGGIGSKRLSEWFVGLSALASRMLISDATLLLYLCATRLGTVQFMAREILESIVNNHPIQHTDSHDLESFAWVFAYTVLRRFLREDEDEANTMFFKDDWITVRKLHDGSFGALELRNVLRQRKSLHTFKIAKSVPERVIPGVIGEFMTVLGALPRANYEDDSPVSSVLSTTLPPTVFLRSRTKMTHLHLIRLIDATIQAIVNETQVDG
ncbi:hypothetical protein PLEOSDRAFT_1103931 [Pleurotus ostreatus PC15]|uniref:Fungal-type protein kinase domain-containing protein n=1 Tax=Pleurotus ostreatus (strain PC15) TaxID=1137138 RepID=A0A067NJL9_PLEO1|nr:hypothetical protein PLEOSDRAFT_1103931 [Pleurotus ostreatus PC15]